MHQTHKKTVTETAKRKVVKNDAEAYAALVHVLAASFKYLLTCTMTHHCVTQRRSLNCPNDCFIFVKAVPQSPPFDRAVADVM